MSGKKHHRNVDDDEQSRMKKTKSDMPWMYWDKKHWPMKWVDGEWQLGLVTDPEYNKNLFEMSEYDQRLLRQFLQDMPTHLPDKQPPIKWYFDAPNGKTYWYFMDNWKTFNNIVVDNFIKEHATEQVLDFSYIFSSKDTFMMAQSIHDDFPSITPPKTLDFIDAKIRELVAFRNVLAQLSPKKKVSPPTEVPAPVVDEPPVPVVEEPEPNVIRLPSTNDKMTYAMYLREKVAECSDDDDDDSDSTYTDYSSTQPPPPPPPPPPTPSPSPPPRLTKDSINDITWYSWSNYGLGYYYVNGKWYTYHDFGFETAKEFHSAMRLIKEKIIGGLKWKQRNVYRNKYPNAPPLPILHRIF